MFWLAEVFNGSYSEQEMKRMEQWAHRERARMVQDLLSALGRGTLSGVGRLVGSTGGAVGRGYGAVRRWQRRRAAIRELNALSDRTLRDIGLVRGDIPAVVASMLDNERRGRSDPGNLHLLTARRDEKQGTSVRDTGEHDWQRAA